MDKTDCISVNLDFSGLASQHRILAHASVECVRTRVEWGLGREKHEKEHAAREYIHRRPIVLFGSLLAQLRCFVLGRTALRFEYVSVISLENLHHPEVADFHPAFCINEDIFQFYVAMDDTLLM